MGVYFGAKVLQKFDICKKNATKCYFFAKKFGYIKKKQYLCTAFEKNASGCYRLVA